VLTDKHQDWLLMHYKSIRGGVTMKRKFSVFMSALFVAVLIFSSLTTARQKKFNWKEFSGSKITVLNMQQSYSKGLEAQLPEFEKLTGIKVEQETMGQQNVVQKINVEMAAHSNTYDLVFAESDRLPQYVESGWLEDISRYFNNKRLTDGSFLDKKDFIKSTLDAFKYDGKYYGLPYMAATVIMYYRKDIFDKYGISGPPDTFDDLLQAAKKINTPEVPAIALRGQPGAVMNVWHWSMFLYGMGGRIFKDYPQNFTPVLNSPKAEKALQVYCKLMQDYSSPGAASANFDDIVLAMQQGKVAIAIEGAPLGGRILDPAQSKVRGKLGFALIPKGPGGRYPAFTAQGFVIPKGSKNKGAAYLFLQWATSKNVLKNIAIKGTHVAVTRKSLWSDPDFIKKYNFDFGAGSYLQAFQKSLEIAPTWYRPTFEKWTEVGDRIGLAVSEAIVKKKTPKEALAEANRDITQIVKRAGKIK
jgi:ABC-type glycerol-3-phosphate transport system substrate-binding protein